MKVPEDLAGKKIRCKECDATFTVEKPKSAAGKGKPAPKPKKKDGSGEKPAKAAAPVDDDDDDGKNPYSLTDDKDKGARCPHCIKPMPATAKVCLNCGFNIVTRTRAERKAVYEPTGQEKFMWLLPGIACVITIIGLITTCIIVFMKTKDWMEDSWFQQDDKSKGYVVKPGCFQLMNVMATAFFCYHLGRFAFKRLIKNYRPPEREIEKEDEGDD